MDSRDWLAEWSRCLLLLELARSYTATGRTQGCEKLMARLEESRARMAGAPALVQSLMSELCYVVWLLPRGEVVEARRHAHEATRKVSQVEQWLQKQRHAQARERGSDLQRRSLQLQSKVRELLARSARLLASSPELERRAQVPGKT